MRKKKFVLALLGGKPVLKQQLPEVHNIGRGEIAAASKAIKEGPLSGFLGTASPRFLGGKYVKLFEKIHKRVCYIFD